MSYGGSGTVSEEARIYSRPGCSSDGRRSLKGAFTLSLTSPWWRGQGADTRVVGHLFTCPDSVCGLDRGGGGGRGCVKGD